jgi:hypothetical protein
MIGQPSGIRTLRSIGRPALFAALAALAASCADDLSPQSLVDKFRVLGVRAEPAAAAPGDAVQVAALLADPLGEGRSVASLWFACLLLPGDFATSCADPSSGGVFAFALGDEFRFVAPALPEGTDAAAALVTVVACAGGTFVLPEPGDPDGTMPRCAGGDLVLAVKRVPVTTIPPLNRNPAIAGIRIDDDPFPDDRPPVLPACPESGDCPRPTFAVELEPGAAETYTEIVFDEPVEKQEEVFTSWFGTAGAFRRIRSGGTEPRVEWDPPRGPAVVEFWFVVHDGRGGADWARRRLVVE